MRNFNLPFKEVVMRRKQFTSFCLILVFVLIVSVFCDSAFSAPVRGKVYNLRQPDGSKVAVKVWGDEFYQRVESLDGYTLIRDEDGWIRYAELSADESEFVATDAVYGGEELGKHFKAQKLKDTPGFIICIKWIIIKIIIGSKIVLPLIKFMDSSIG